MAGVSLPDRANLTQLRKQARELQRAVRAGSAAARELVADYHPAGAPDPGAAAAFPLHAARLVISRQYGFASWTRLKRHIELVQQYTRVPPAAARAFVAAKASGDGAVGVAPLGQEGPGWGMSSCGWGACGTRTTSRSGGPRPGSCWPRGLLLARAAHPVHRADRGAGPR